MQKRYFIIALLVIMTGALYPESATAQPSQNTPPIRPPPELLKIIKEGLSNNKEIQSLESQVASL
nr:hypothetical protein [Desulfobacterales bacterium]